MSGQGRTAPQHSASSIMLDSRNWIFRIEGLSLTSYANSRVPKWLHRPDSFCFHFSGLHLKPDKMKTPLNMKHKVLMRSATILCSCAPLPFVRNRMCLLVICDDVTDSGLAKFGFGYRSKFTSLWHNKINCDQECNSGSQSNLLSATSPVPLSLFSIGQYWLTVQVLFETHNFSRAWIIHIKANYSDRTKIK